MRILLFLIVAVCGGLLWILYEADPNTSGSPRQDHLKTLSDQLNLSDEQALMWSPFLNAGVFPVGAVFIDNGFGQSLTSACEQIEVAVSNPRLRIGDGLRYELSPEAFAPVDARLALEGAKSLEYRLSIDEARVARGKVELLRQLLGNVDCLAEIANVPITVLYGVYSGDEAYVLTRSLTANLSLEAVKTNFSRKFGVAATGENDSNFSREDVPLIWALTHVHYKDPRFPVGPDRASDRRQLASELVRVESDYLQRAIPSTSVRAPSEAEVARVRELAEAASFH